jgi:hypothetical protein
LIAFIIGRPLRRVWCPLHLLAILLLDLREKRASLHKRSSRRTVFELTLLNGKSSGNLPFW